MAFSLAHVYLPQIGPTGAVYPMADVSIDGIDQFYPDWQGDAEMSPSYSVQPAIIDAWVDDPIRTTITVTVTNVEETQQTYVLDVDFYGDPKEMPVHPNGLLASIASSPEHTSEILAADANGIPVFHDFASDKAEVVGAAGGTVGFYGSTGTTRGSITDGNEDPALTTLLQVLDSLGLLTRTAEPADYAFGEVRISGGGPSSLLGTAPVWQDGSDASYAIVGFDPTTLRSWADGRLNPIGPPSAGVSPTVTLNLRCSAQWGSSSIATPVLLTGHLNTYPNPADSNPEADTVGAFYTANGQIEVPNTGAITDLSIPMTVVGGVTASQITSALERGCYLWFTASDTGNASQITIYEASLSVTWA